MSQKVALACTVCLNRNYTTRKNTSSQAVRLEMKKFCKACGRHTLHHETK